MDKFYFYFRNVCRGGLYFRVPGFVLFSLGTLPAPITKVTVFKNIFNTPLRFFQTHTMPDLPAHASPALAPSDGTSETSQVFSHSSDYSDSAPPPALLSPAFTPPSTPGTGTPAGERNAPSIPLDTSAPLTAPRLFESLPHVTCVVRARIPTTTGQEMFLHLYQNDVDNKEHLAIVFGSHIRSRSLDAPRPGETEMDRMIRGAYVGILYPGRKESGLVVQTATASPLQKSIHKPAAAVTDTTRRSHAPGSPPSTSSQETKDHVHAQAFQGLEEKPEASLSPLVRIHSECYTGETVWSARCDCGEQLDEAARLMSLPSAKACGGVIVYLRQEGRGIGLSEKLKAYNLQDLGNDTVEANLLLRHPADARSYGLATAILVDLGLGSDTSTGDDSFMDTDSTVWGEDSPHGREPANGTGIRLMTNNPDKIRAVEGPNREVIVHERVPMIPLAWRTGGLGGIHSSEVGSYLRTKVGHAHLQIISLEYCDSNSNPDRKDGTYAADGMR